MQGTVLITNPAAGNGRAAAAALQVLDQLRGAGREVQARFGTGPGSTEDLAREAADAGAEAVVVIGGDGSIHDAANGVLTSARPDCPLGIVPLGSGNDFVKMLGLSRGWGQACVRILSGVSRQVDLGRCRVDGGETRYFTNGVGMGFDADVALAARGKRWLGSDLMYAAALIQVLAAHRGNPELELTLDGEVVRERIVLLAAANGRCYGGSFHLAPSASLDDGLLDVVWAGDLGRLGILGLVPAVMMGRHLGRSSVQHRNAARITVRSSRPLVVHADGEILGEQVTELTVEVVPGALTVLA